MVILVALGNLCNFLMTLNSASNFILYCALSDKYRQTMKALCFFKKYRAKRQVRYVFVEIFFYNPSIYLFRTQLTLHGSHEMQPKKLNWLVFVQNIIIRWQRAMPWVIEHDMKDCPPSHQQWLKFHDHQSHQLPSTPILRWIAGRVVVHRITIQIIWRLWIPAAMAMAMATVPVRTVCRGVIRWHSDQRLDTHSIVNQQIQNFELWNFCF